MDDTLDTELLGGETNYGDQNTLHRCQSSWRESAQRNTEVTKV